MKIVIIHIIFILLHISFLFSSEENQSKEIVVIAVPGLLGNDNDRGYSDSILSLIPNNYKIYKMGTIPLTERPDLSQQRCLDHLTKKIEPYLNNNMIFVSTSQGSGTTTHYIAQNQEILKNKIKMFICEGYTTSFNHCVSHSIKSEYPLISMFPFKYYWLPYVTKYLPYFQKIFFPFINYNPTGQQPFEDLKHLPKDLPIIIVHCKQDHITPYKGARIAYYILRSTGHEKTYLISIDKRSLSKNNSKDKHINLLTKNNKQKIDLQTLINHLLNNQPIVTDLSEYQPDQKNFENIAIKLINKEQWIKKLNSLLIVGKVCMIFYCIWKIKNYITQQKKGTFLQVPFKM